MPKMGEGTHSRFTPAPAGRPKHRKTGKGAADSAEASAWQPMQPYLNGQSHGAHGLNMADAMMLMAQTSSHGVMPSSQTAFLQGAVTTMQGHHGLLPLAQLHMPGLQVCTPRLRALKRGFSAAYPPELLALLPSYPPELFARLAACRMAARTSSSTATPWVPALEGAPASAWAPPTRGLTPAPT